MGLGARLGVNFPGAQTGAVAAGTIPLGKAAAGCGAENFDFHERTLQGAKRECEAGWSAKDLQTQNGPIAAAVGPHNSRLQFSVSVRADFAIQIDLFVLRGDPFHSDCSLNSKYQFAGHLENNTGICGREAEERRKRRTSGESV